MFLFFENCDRPGQADALKKASSDIIDNGQENLFIVELRLNLLYEEIFGVFNEMAEKIIRFRNKYNKNIKESVLDFEK